MLESLNFQIIGSDQLLTFGKSITGLFKDYKPNDTFALYPFVKRAINTYDDYSKAYEREIVNPYTVKLLNCDKLRDAGFLGLKSYFESWSYSEEIEKQKAANTLLAVIEKHGSGAAYFGYKAETAALTKIINEVKGYCMKELQLIDGVSRFNLLVTRQAEFEEMQKSSVTRPPSGLPLLIEVRPKLVEALRKLMNIVDYQSTENPTDAKLAGYVKAINELIVLTMTTARAAETRNEKKKKEEKAASSK